MSRFIDFVKVIFRTKPELISPKVEIISTINISELIACINENREKIKYLYSNEELLLKQVESLKNEVKWMKKRMGLITNDN